MSYSKNGKNSYRFECMIHGKRFCKTFRFYTESPTEIEMKFLEWKLECEKGCFCTTNYTLKEFANIWIENYIKPNCTAQVSRNYQNNLKNWIIPQLGHYKLQDITPMVLDEFINYLKNSKTKYANRTNDKLSNSTIEKVYENIRTLITLAYKKGIIQVNPCDRVSLNLRKPVEEKLHYWDVDNYKRALGLLENVNDELKALAIEFALKTGLRRSEIFGITWNDVDFENKTITVNKSRQKVDGKMTVLNCKTASSVRTITVPTSIIEKLSKLHEGSDTTFVFEKLDYDSLTAWYRKWIRRNNLPYITFHDLRHTHASLLLYKGVDLKTISKRLGHSSIGITMNTYTHVMRELDIKASEAIEAI